MRAQIEKHDVCFYQRDSEWLDALFKHLGSGLEGGQTLVVAADSRHLKLLREFLDSNDLNAALLVASGVLIELDAEHIREHLSAGGGVSASRFSALAEKTFAGRHRRGAGQMATVYGEIVDLYCRLGRVEDAVELERLWNEAAKVYSLSLLCGYEMRPGKFTPDDVSSICATHQRCVAMDWDVDVARSLRRALREHLGEKKATELWAKLVVEQPRVPGHVSALRWVQENVPEIGRAIESRN
ncbi:MAG TPA: MEDS domain-containing protein [Planctomycetota bacterium]|nr:MEDS domain-containing protein [Planctomycetota bacterium]